LDLVFHSVGFLRVALLDSALYSSLALFLFPGPLFSDRTMSGLGSVAGAAVVVVVVLGVRDEDIVFE
jgi:hypothetical protein